MASSVMPIPAVATGSLFLVLHLSARHSCSSAPFRPPAHNTKVHCLAPYTLHPCKAGETSWHVALIKHKQQYRSISYHAQADAHALTIVQQAHQLCAL